MRGMFQSGAREPLIREIELPASFEECYGRIGFSSPYSALLSGGSDYSFGRFSYIGCDPYLVFRCSGSHQTIEFPDRVESASGDPFDTLKKIIEGCEVRSDWNEAPFYAGGIGAFGFDLGQFIERLPRRAAVNLPLPDLIFAVYRTILIHDRLAGRTHLSSVEYSAEGGGAGAAEKCADRARRWIEEPVVEVPAPYIAKTRAPVSNFTREQYLRAVEKTLEHIRAGDIYQVNLSQQFRAGLSSSPQAYFKKLRDINPAPFGAYLDYGDFKIISSSPERFLKKNGRQVETRPIKGTRPRGADAAGDAALARELILSEKDNAELAMIVDLERNDLGRVCEFGSVAVTEEKTLESYATVHHLVATVKGVLREGCGPVELLRAAFPGGSITGCPKIRSIEIIDELEPTRRGFYTGSIGWIGFNGDMDTNIVIRTLVAKGGEVWFNVGGGIVADSDPAAEYQETLDKGRALVEALAAGDGSRDSSAAKRARAE
ncbi:MAG: Aminodeoxychorismate synthase component 1 [bacterium ADurb.Bin236]|nr:MAG: Aminodeoxychorismate synthase component 1 [bacterium ADurb.Bin236]